MNLVFDIGATNTRMALSSNGVQMTKPHIVATQTDIDGPKALVEEMKKFTKGKKIQHIAGGVAGTIDRKNGIIFESPNLPHWKNAPLGKFLKDTFDAEIYIENDTAMVGLGEVIAYSRKGICVYVTISTGVNGARFVDGQIDASTHGFEAGRELIPTPNGELKSLETLIGGHAMQVKYGRLPKYIDNPAVWEAEAGYLAMGLYNMMLLWSPRTIILGGSMMRDIDIAVVEAKLQSLPKVFPEWPELRLAQLGSLGGLYGGLELLRYKKNMNLSIKQ